MAAHDINTITVKETKSLAHRLECRGMSLFSLADSPEQQSDLVLAGRTMRAMARHLNDTDVLYLDRRPS
jgi:hypothetical protein